MIATVAALEDDPLFNAGRGAVLASNGEAQLDAAVMDGDRRAGAVAGLRTIRNPVHLAAAVRAHTPHLLLVGAGAEALAREVGVAQVSPDYFVTPSRVAQQQAAAATGGLHLDHGGGTSDVHGTVGAVAVDRAGRVAAATSTGGMVNQRPGRVGDAPQIGAGTFAWNETAAVSCTGHGEPFITLSIAARVSARMEMLGQDLEAAARHAIETDLASIGGSGGLIAVDATGQVALCFNTGGMFRGSAREGEAPHVAIW